nr:MAG TPA: hypothetical protein [Caudoviricetes sp.]
MNRLKTYMNSVHGWNSRKASNACCLCVVSPKYGVLYSQI